MKQFCSKQQRDSQERMLSFQLYKADNVDINPNEMWRKGKACVGFMGMSR